MTQPTDRRRTNTELAPRPAIAALDARALVPEHLRALHDEVLARARASGADALILTGSTARAARTPISDIDYHLIGDPIATDDLPGELDLHALTAAALRARLREGDDFVHWSLRFGRVIFDHGVVMESVRFMRSRRLWPDSDRKLVQARKCLALAHAMVASGDQEAALEQARAALTLTARWRLLADRAFPLSRAELPAQLRELGHATLADDLEAAISHKVLPLQDLDACLDSAETLIAANLGLASRTGHSRAA